MNSRLLRRLPEDEVVDPQNVPINYFLDANRFRVDSAVSGMKDLFKRAAKVCPLIT